MTGTPQKLPSGTLDIPKGWKWKNPEVVLKVPKKLARDLEIIAMHDAPNKRWSAKAREILYSYVAMHRARGNVE